MGPLVAAGPRRPIRQPPHSPEEVRGYRSTVVVAAAAAPIGVGVARGSQATPAVEPPNPYMESDRRAYDNMRAVFISGIVAPFWIMLITRFYILTRHSTKGLLFLEISFSKLMVD